MQEHEQVQEQMQRQELMQVLRPFDYAQGQDDSFRARVMACALKNRPRRNIGAVQGVHTGSGMLWNGDL